MSTGAEQAGAWSEPLHAMGADERAYRERIQAIEAWRARTFAGLPYASGEYKSPTPPSPRDLQVAQDAPSVLKWGTKSYTPDPLDQLEPMKPAATDEANHTGNAPGKSTPAEKYTLPPGCWLAPEGTTLADIEAGNVPRPPQERLSMSRARRIGHGTLVGLDAVRTSPVADLAKETAKLPFRIVGGVLEIAGTWAFGDARHHPIRALVSAGVLFAALEAGIDNKLAPADQPSGKDTCTSAHHVRMQIGTAGLNGWIREHTLVFSLGDDNTTVSDLVDSVNSKAAHSSVIKTPSDHFGYRQEYTAAGLDAKNRELFRHNPVTHKPTDIIPRGTVCITLPKHPDRFPDK